MKVATVARPVPAVSAADWMLPLIVPAVVPVPPEFGKLPFNRGIESLLVVPKGRQLAAVPRAALERELLHA